MAAEKDIQVSLVLEIEKHPFLYNPNLPDYARKDVTDKSWNEISSVTGLTVNECKEKWRNIRSTFLRSLKSKRSSSGPKKPYYLRDYLKFIVPHVKPRNDSPIRVLSGEDSVPVKIEVEYEPEDPLENHDMEETVSVSTNNVADDDTSNTMADLLKNAVERKSNGSKDNYSLSLFLLSLLPEFNNMTEQQVRTFKINVLRLIDDIKENN